MTRCPVDGFKQRIIGAVVLICLAIIFVPMLFDKPHRKPATQTIQIPSEPQSQSITIEQPRPPSNTSGASSSAAIGSASPTSSGSSAPSGVSGSLPEAPSTPPQSQMPAAGAKAAASSPTTEKPSQPAHSATASGTQAGSAHPSPSTATTAKPKPKPLGNWVVQLGSFSEGNNARQLREKVRGKGYAAFLETARAGGKNVTRVFAGPFAEKSDALAAKNTLDRVLGVKSLVMAKKDRR